MLELYLNNKDYCLNSQKVFSFGDLMLLIWTFSFSSNLKSLDLYDPLTNTI